MALDTDAVWVPVLPSLSDFARDLSRGTQGAGTAAGEQVARELEAAVSKSEKAVSTAAAAAEKAQNKVADATGKVRVEQEKYNAALASGDPVKIATAEERLATARRRQAEATTDAERRSRDLTSAQEALVGAQGDVARAAAEQERAFRLSTMSTEDAEQASKDLDTANVVLAASMAAIVAGAVVVGKGLYDLGSQFDDMFDTIRIGTGASGDAFAGLQDSAMRVAQTVPAMDGGLSQIGSTMADLNTRLGATGKPLETLTSQFVQLSNMGIDADINDVSGALTQFSIDAADAPAALDDLFRISQASGRSITDITANLSKSGPALQMFGFGLTESAGLLGALDKAGLDSEKTVGSMTKALSVFAKEGKDPQKALWGTIVSIDELSAAGKDMEAVDLANKLFGAKGGAGFVAAVQSGKFEYDDFLHSIGASSDTILGVAGETADFAEQWQLFKQMLAVELAPVAERVFGAIGDSMTWLKDNGIPALQSTAEWVVRNKDVLTALAIGLGSVTAGIALARTGLVVFTAAQRMWNVVNLLSTEGVKGLNKAMKANLFGLIAGAIVGLVAGLVWFFKSTETGQAMWATFTAALATGWQWVSGVLSAGWAWISQAFTTGWEVIKGAFAAAWAFIQPIITGLKIAFGVIVFAALLFWEGVKLYWTLVANIVVWAWNTLIKPAFDALKAGLQAVGAFFSWVWIALIQPAWNALGAGIAWVWNAIIRPVWDALKFALGLVGTAFQWVWNAVIKPAWDALGAGIKWVWDTVVAPVWDVMKMALDGLGIMFSWVWNSVIKPAWDALGAGIRWVADNVVHPVFDGLKTGLGFVETAFSKAVDFIGRMWDRIKGITAAPVKFVIDSIYNDGIRGVWSKVAGWLGLEELPEWRPAWLGEYAQGTASIVPGPRSVGRDNLEFVSTDGRYGIGLAGGEGIAHQHLVDGLGGAENWDRLNSTARTRGPAAVRKELGGFSDGGTLPGWEKLTSPIQFAMARAVGKAFPGQQINSGTRYEDVGSGYDFHMAQKAVDFAPSQALANWIASEYGTSVLELYWDPGPNLDTGMPVGAIGGHTDHVHWAMDSIIDPYTGAVISSDVPEGSAGGGGMSMVSAMVGQAFSSILDPIISAMPDFGGGLFGKMPGALISKVVDGAKEHLGSLAGVFGGGGGGTPLDLSGVAGDNLAIGQAAADMVGWKGHEWDMLKELWTRESQWNNNAQNPTSTAYGIAQFLDSTWSGFGPKTADPRKQIEYGVQYIQQRYGTPSAAVAFHDANNWYDQGGWLEDGGIGVNHSGKPEPVFTNPQWTLIKSLVISTAELLDPIRLMARDGRDAIAHLAQIAADTREGVQNRVDSALEVAGAAVWAALPGEVKGALTVAGAVGRQWEKVSGYLGEKAIAWSKGEWPIGSGRIVAPEAGPQWQDMHLDESLEKVARSNMDLAEQVIAGKVAPGNDPVASALFDIFGRAPILPDLARIAALGPNAIDAATDAAMHAFETGETARLEEWTESNSQLTEAVLRARDAAILTGDMVQGAVNGYLNWAMASDSQGRQGSWQEYFQHYGGQYGTDQGDWLLSQIGFGGIVGGKLKDSLANVLIEAAQSPLLSAPEILDADGRVIGSQLAAAGEIPAEAPVTAMPEMVDMSAPVVPTTDDEAEVSAEQLPAGTQVTVTLPADKTAYTNEEVKQLLDELDQRVDDLEIKVEDGVNAPAPLGAGVSGIV